MSAYFPCSNKLKPYLLRYLKYPSNPAVPHPSNMANLVLQNLSKTFKHGGRTELLGVVEIKAFCEHRTSKRQCFVLPGKSLKNVKVFTATLVSESVATLASQLGIHDSDVAQQFGIAVMKASGTVFDT